MRCWKGICSYFAGPLLDLKIQITQTFRNKDEVCFLLLKKGQINMIDGELFKINKVVFGGNLRETDEPKFAGVVVVPVTVREFVAYLSAIVRCGHGLGERRFHPNFSEGCAA